METILQEISKAYDARLYYAAISMSLTLPDICANLEAAENARTSGNKSRYMKWYRENLADRRMFEDITPEDCYSLRSGVVHSGRFGYPEKQQFSRIVFMPPSPIAGIKIDAKHRPNRNASMERTLLVGVQDFLQDMLDGVCEWYGKNCDREPIKSRLDNLVQFHPNGFKHYVGPGTPCIA